MHEITGPWHHVLVNVDVPNLCSTSLLSANCACKVRCFVKRYLHVHGIVFEEKLVKNALFRLLDYSASVIAIGNESVKANVSLIPLTL